jgi:hypothetical protein
MQTMRAVRMTLLTAGWVFVLAGLTPGQTPVLTSVGAAVRLVGQATGQPPQPTPGEAAKVAAAAKDSPAADFTRNKALKAKVSVDFTQAPLGDILKELAHLVEVQTDRPVMWSYGPGFPYSRKLTFAVKDQPLEVALDQLLTKAGGGLGYVVVSKEGDKYDGWVLLTTTGERGSVPPAATPAEEAEAAEKLALARRLIEAGKGAASKPVLELVLRKYPGTKAAAEAKALLARIDKEP